MPLWLSLFFKQLCFTSVATCTISIACLIPGSFLACGQARPPSTIWVTPFSVTRAGSLRSVPKPGQQALERGQRGELSAVHAPVAGHVPRRKQAQVSEGGEGGQAGHVIARRVLGSGRHQVGEGQASAGGGHQGQQAGQGAVTGGVAAENWRQAHRAAGGWGGGGGARDTGRGGGVLLARRDWLGAVTRGGTLR
ncbi:hypothetical protein V8C86DRAFT_2550464 [Haematococcus lacustris]